MEKTKTKISTEFLTRAIAGIVMAVVFLICLSVIRNRILLYETDALSKYDYSQVKVYNGIVRGYRRYPGGTTFYPLKDVQEIVELEDGASVLVQRTPTYNHKLNEFVEIYSNGNRYAYDKDSFAISTSGHYLIAVMITILLVLPSFVLPVCLGYAGVPALVLFYGFLLMNLL